MSRRGVAALAAIAVAALLWLLLRHECASGGAMASAYRTCTCAGIERLDFDATPADGPRRTICYGWVTSRTCYRNRDGDEMPCERNR